MSFASSATAGLATFSWADSATRGKAIHLSSALADFLFGLLGFMQLHRKSSCTEPGSRFTENSLYCVFCVPAVSSCCSSLLRQLEVGLYSLMALATTPVFFPRSFSYTAPSSPTINVITPDERYSAG